MTVSVVCGYADGMLESAWFRAYKRLKRTVRRSGFDVRVELTPLGELPEQVDVLFLPPGVPEPPDGVVPVSTTAASLQQEWERASAELVRVGTLTHAPPRDRALATHHGFRVLGDRPRLAD